MRYSYQDTLARLHAETRQTEAHAERRRGLQRMLDYRAGLGIAAAIASRVAAGCRSAAESVATLRAVVRQQPDTLTGRVTATELAVDIERHRAEDERQRAQRNADAAYYAEAQELWQRHYAGAARAQTGLHRKRD